MHENKTIKNKYFSSFSWVDNIIITNLNINSYILLSYKFLFIVFVIVGILCLYIVKEKRLLLVS